MKRYRVFNMDIDSRAAYLTHEIKASWEPEIQEKWHNIRASIEASLVREFGEAAAEAKTRNFIDLGPKPFSILAFHNRFAAQIRNTFVVGCFYPALTGACALGERILNHLLLVLRDDFSAHPQYGKVARKASFDNWTIAIDTLVTWGILVPSAAESFRTLHSVRNRAIHFNPETDTNDRALALKAIKLLDRIIEDQFPVMGQQPWFIPDTPGESYIAKEWEQKPFIRRIYIPNCLLVGPAHDVKDVVPKLVVHDGDDYPDQHISDSE